MGVREGAGNGNRKITTYHHARSAYDQGCCHGRCKGCCGRENYEKDNSNVKQWRWLSCFAKLTVDLFSVMD